MLDRAIQSAGPVGSTFEPITAIAALQSGVWSPNQTFDDTGQFCVGAGLTEQCRHNSGQVAFGVLDVADAIKVSSDDFFYRLGALLSTPGRAHPNGGALQQWARGFGIGQATGIDLPGEITGTLPTPRWREQRNQLEQQCDTATGPFRYTNGHGQIGPRKLPGWDRSPMHSPGGCGIADGANRPWSVGDAESLAVGQGDIQVTPLQLAVAYAAVANGGMIVHPHIGADIQTSNGTVLQRIDPSAVRHLSLDSASLRAVLAGLRASASRPGGTTNDVFGRFAQPVHGQAGTAQYLDGHGTEAGYAWYAGFVPASATGRPIVVVVWVPDAGYGAAAAAPVARQILSQWFSGTPGRYQP
ncbi:MAG: penicillin-binding transpeptidase domain-containing protein, partial [Solirubrobacteraceae bacterium]